MEKPEVRPPRILIVDDLSFMRTVIKEILNDHGFTLAGEAQNGAEGWKAYTILRPDAVLMDITMPVMNGLESLKRIRYFDPDACVVMCSALGEQEYILRAIRYGARDFIVKPFRPERIVSALRIALRIDE
ncbi:MAG: response regulator [Spirochaetales bacterium]|nr:response regulator [Spirochaetales bacterium]